MYFTKAGLAASVALAGLLAWSQSAAVLGADFGTSGGSADDKAYKRNGTLLFSCCGGTLGALVSDRSNVLIHYILSNNHVLALSNRATIGDPVIAPGLIDTSPVCDETALGVDVVGTLSDFVPIEATGNTVDAAIATVVPGTMASNGAIADIGPVNGVLAGSPLGKDVMKRGRTTGLTYGNVALTNVDVEVTYGEECGSKKGFTAVFSNQIYVTGGDFSAGGDSGSLVLTTQPDITGDGVYDVDGVDAVGLLFAGNSGAPF